MKHLIIFLILAAPCMAWITSDPNDIPLIGYDPGKVIESPSDPNNMRFTVVFEVPKHHYKAMKYLNLTMIDMLERSTLRRVWSRIIEKARAKWAKPYTIEQLEAKE